jgi:hypothetical protein
MMFRVRKEVGECIHPCNKNSESLNFEFVEKWQFQKKNGRLTKLPEKVCAFRPSDLDHVFNRLDELSYTKPEA